ncbi:galactoside alpha-(1,2)-fucosyltransferase 2-like isoform X2 [Mytilus californianus]|uniref:galactoside alpha-(1,2)-fucosyltransferase 2-like isoform X2 n=1 Tax=Mytilus californianus TaxID=6549 RepID=UPI00224590A0|nr:galactoside alpha-(1,2)-fucosyltransferase 2-like isoform X2 [Mytilus californianus]
MRNISGSMAEKKKPLQQKLLYLVPCILVLISVYLLLRQLFDTSTVVNLPVPLYRREMSTTHSDGVRRNKKGSICPILQGGLGNRLFQFSTTFAVARTKQMELIVPSDTEIRKVFVINVTSKNRPKGLCKGFRKVLDKASPTYNKSLLNFSSEDNIQLGYGLQSWKYFHMYDKELRRQLTFQKHIQNTAEQTIGKILQRRKITSRKSITLVGVHIRRGDKVGNHDGFNIATPEYLNRSVNYYTKRYAAVIFLVISDGMAWSKNNMPSHVPVEFISLGKREFDMATAVACDHTIMTIGTFGWWIGYLTGGEVVYVKDAAKKGSRFERILNFEDHFYPQWVGL